MSLVELIPSLEPRLEQLLVRHREASAAIDWSYHDYLPLEAYHADPHSHGPLSPVAYTAVETALLTEANLPWYTAVLYEGFRNSLWPMREFVRVWTAEEDQHATLLETYLLLTDNGDHAERGRVRKAVLAGGWSHDLAGPFEGTVYTAIQETQTRAFYIHAARACERQDPGLARALRRIAKDETLHATFYRDVVKAHLEVEPDYVLPVARVLMQFQMPGSVIPDYEKRHAYLSQHLFGPEHFSQDVVEALCSYWEIARLEPRLPEAGEAQRRLRRYRVILRRLGRRIVHDPQASPAAIT